MKRTTPFLLAAAVTLGIIAISSPQIATAEDAETTSEKKEATSEQAAEAPPQTPPAPEPIELKDPVATVNGKTISSSELTQNANAMLAQMGANISMLPPQQQLQAYHRVLDEMIIESILEEKTKGMEVDQKEVDEQFNELKQQFGTEEEFKKRLEEMGDSEEDLKKAIAETLKKRNWIQSQLPEDAAPSDEETKKFYDENPQNFESPETVRASHILISTTGELSDEQLEEKKELANEIKDKVDAGEDFAELAKQYSEDPGSKESGGDLDFFTKDRMVPEFADRAFSMEKGEVSEPVKTQFGYHIIKVTDTKEASKISYEEAQERITQFLTDQANREEMGKVLNQLKEEAEISNNLPPLPTAPGVPAGS